MSKTIKFILIFILFFIIGLIFGTGLGGKSRTVQEYEKNNLIISNEVL